MKLEDILGPIGGLGGLAKQLGMNEQQASAGANALLPGLLDAFKTQSAATPDISSLLGKLDLAGMAGQLLGKGSSNPGNAILGQLLGGKDASRALAQQASASSGLDVGQLKSMLPVLATLVAGFMSRGNGNSSQANPLVEAASGLLGGALKKLF